MKQIITPNGYLAIETIFGIDVYMGDCFVCELHGKTFADFSYNEKIDSSKLDDAIDEELSIEEFLIEC